MPVKRVKKEKPEHSKSFECSAEHKRKSFVLWSKTKYWSDYVTKHSFALDLEEGVFTWDSPRKIAQSLKRSAEASINRKAGPFQSAMSMLNFYINRAGKNLKPNRKRTLEQTKVELRKLFNTRR